MSQNHLSTWRSGRSYTYHNPGVILNNYNTRMRLGLFDSEETPESNYDSDSNLTNAQNQSMVENDHNNHDHDAHHFHSIQNQSMVDNDDHNNNNDNHDAHHFDGIQNQSMVNNDNHNNTKGR